MRIIILFIYLMVGNPQISELNLDKDLLGKEISNLSERHNCSYISDNKLSKSYVFEKNLGFYHGYKLSRISLNVDDKERISNAYGIIISPIEESFLESLKTKYGNPDYMVKPDSIQNNEQLNLDGMTIKEGYGTSKEVSFDKKPLFIVWIKEDYELGIHPNYKKDYFTVNYKKRNQ